METQNKNQKNQKWNKNRWNLNKSLIKPIYIFKAN